MTRPLALASLFLVALLVPADTGPTTEKRFPPLAVPPGFKATLFACDPLIEYPSVIARGPRPGSLFVAIDYMTGLGTGIERRDEVRLIEDTDGDGDADRSTVVAKGFNSIQGLAHHDGTLFVMHAPYLSAVRLAKGERKDLLTGLGLPPEEDQIRLHNANGVTLGHDGWLYLALGDRGCDVKRPEGDRLLLEGGGILRCRPDGRELHVFSTGLRNIYDVALDEELNVFVRDNENDGGNYKIRVCHSFFGADHGYPYLYHDRPDEALPPLADLGLGSAAGGVCYLETQFPAEYRGNLFFCEWGRAVVRYPMKRSGASFAKPKEIAFAAGAAKDPYGFKPTDVVVDHDGSLFVSDWADGQRPRRGRGRIYHVRHAEGKREVRPLPTRQEELLSWLDSESYDERCRAQAALEPRPELLAALKKLGVRGRLHAVWIIARMPGAVEKLLAVANADADPRVMAQAIRAIADHVDPLFTREDTATLPERFASLGEGADARVQLEVITALGRLRWPGAPAWLRKNLKTPDATLAHAAMWATRRGNNWPTVLKLLDEPPTAPFRAIARRAAAEQYDATLVLGLIARLKAEPNTVRRREYADLLARVHRKPAVWTYWGFRPPPHPTNAVAWEKTEAIQQALDLALTDLDRGRRLDVLRLMLRENVPARARTVSRWLAAERDAATVTALLNALRGGPTADREHLAAVVRDRGQTAANRLLALSLFVEGSDGGVLVKAAEGTEDGPVLAELLRVIAARKVDGAGKLALAKLTSADADVRAAALAVVAEVGTGDLEKPILARLADTDVRVRAAAALAAGKRGIRPAADAILKMTGGPDAEVRRSSLEGLRLLREPRALTVALAALADGATAVTALECVGDLGGPDDARAVAEAALRNPSAEVLAAAGKVLVGWGAHREQVARALADVHGGGVLLVWRLPGSRMVLSEGIDALVRLKAGAKAECTCEVAVGEDVKAEFFATRSSPMTVLLNGKVVYENDRPGVPGPYPERFEATLVKGTNRLHVRVAGEFALRFRRKSATAGHERLARASLSRAGNPANGRRIFLNAEKSLCIKCHRVGDQGEKVGPDLTGLGSRFSKAYIIESILEPARTVSPSFEASSFVLKKGTVVTGIKVAEEGGKVTVVDPETKKHVLARSAIEEVRRHTGSAMPDGLEKRLSEDEFVDLISFLVNLKDPRR